MMAHVVCLPRHNISHANLPKNQKVPQLGWEEWCRRLRSRFVEAATTRGERKAVADDLRRARIDVHVGPDQGDDPKAGVLEILISPFSFCRMISTLVKKNTSYIFSMSNVIRTIFALFELRGHVNTAAIRCVYTFRLLRSSRCTWDHPNSNGLPLEGEKIWTTSKHNPRLQDLLFPEDMIYVRVFPCLARFSVDTVSTELVFQTTLDHNQQVSAWGIGCARQRPSAML